MLNPIRPTFVIFLELTYKHLICFTFFLRKTLSQKPFQSILIHLVAWDTLPPENWKDPVQAGKNDGFFPLPYLLFQELPHF